MVTRTRRADALSLEAYPPEDAIALARIQDMSQSSVELDADADADADPHIPVCCICQCPLGGPAKLTAHCAFSENEAEHALHQTCMGNGRYVLSACPLCDAIG
jgi:hypothetical protein